MTNARFPTSISSSTPIQLDRAMRVETTSALLVIHATPLMRLGVEAAIEDAGQTRRVEGCATLADAAEPLSKMRSGDVVLLEASLWPTHGPLEPTLADAAGRGVALALIAGADFPAARMQGARGLSGVLSCAIAPDALAQAVTELAAGREVFPKSRAVGAASRLARLSNRQFEILELMTRGLLNKQIAWELGLTEGTVKSHVSAILEKLGCDRRTQAIAAFMQSFGVVSRSMTA